MDPLRSAKILLVDSDIFVRTAMDLCFRKKVQTFRAVESVQRAFSSLAEAPWDLVICEGRLPDLSGLDLLGVIACRWPGVVPLLVTDHFSPGLADRAISMGIRDILYKPFDAENLERTLRGALRKPPAANREDKSTPDSLLCWWKSTEILEAWSQGAMFSEDSRRFGHKPGRTPARLWRDDTGGLFEIVNRIRALNRRLLYLERLPGNGSEKAVRTAAILEICLQKFASPALGAGIDIRGDFAPAVGDGVLPASALVISHVLDNLVVNAIQSLMEKTTGSRKIEISARGPEPCFRVKDNGTGMEPDSLSRARQRGFSTRVNGTGLGLFIADRLCRSAGARLHIESEPGLGTTVSVHFPPSTPDRE